MRRIALGLLAGLVAALVMAGPAAGHGDESGAAWLLDGGDHPGWYIPSPTSQSPNLQMIGSVARTRPQNTYRNSDLAFWGRLAFAGHYDGFQIVDVSNPRKPRQLVDYACPGPSTTCPSGRTCCSSPWRRPARARGATPPPSRPASRASGSST